MSDYGTPFPPYLGGVTEMTQHVERKLKGDVYEVKVELDNGAWRVDVFYTDADLASHKLEGRMDSHGGLTWETKPVMV